MAMETSEKKPLSCPVCGKEYSTVKGLRTHKGMMHDSKEERKKRKRLIQNKASKKYNKTKKGKATREKYEDNQRAKPKKERRKTKYEKGAGKKIRLAYQKKLKKRRKQDREKKKQQAVHVTISFVDQNVFD